MAYHSSFSPLLSQNSAIKICCGVPLLPLRTRTRGPAPPTTDYDAVDEVISFFRSNVLFRKFTVESDADKVLIYLTLYISSCLKTLVACPTSTEGAKSLFALAHEMHFDEWDETNALVAGGIVNRPKTVEEGDVLKSYFKQCREEVGIRLVDHCYVDEGTKLNKFWMAFAKKKFMNKELATNRRHR